MKLFFFWQSSQTSVLPPWREELLRDYDVDCIEMHWWKIFASSIYWQLENSHKYFRIHIAIGTQIFTSVFFYHLILKTFAVSIRCLLSIVLTVQFDRDFEKKNERWHSVGFEHTKFNCECIENIWFAHGSVWRDACLIATAVGIYVLSSGNCDTFHNLFDCGNNTSPTKWFKKMRYYDCLIYSKHR